MNIKQFLLMAGTSIVISALSISCADNAANTEGKSSEKVAEEKNEDKFNTRTAENEAEFVVEAVADNYAAIKFAQLAQQKSTDGKVKALATELEKAHKSQLAELQSLAASKSISIPAEETDETKKEITRLSDEKDFSQDWCKKMIDEHEDAIKDFEDAAEKSVDNDVKNWASKTLPETRKHLDELKQLRDSQKK